MTKRRWLAAFGAGLAAALTGSADEIAPVVKRLADVDLFAFGGVGFANVISQGEQDFEAILAHPSSESDFAKVFAAGTPEAKCYALVGLQRTNLAKFQQLSASLRSSKKQVSTMRGCIMSHSSLGEVVKQIEAGSFSKAAGH